MSNNNEKFGEYHLAIASKEDDCLGPVESPQTMEENISFEVYDSMDLNPNKEVELV